MAPDDHNKHRSANSSCGSGTSRSSKKLKQKKVPQRGLGVAQLEKIRLEEQQKKDVSLQSVLQNNNPILLPKFRQNPPLDSNPVFKTNLGSDFPNQNSKTIGLAQKSYKFDQSDGLFAFRPNIANTIYESTPPILNGIPTKELFQSQNSSSSMVRVSSGTSSSSVITYNQMEPPSNQSFYSKICTSSKWPQEDKINIGIKRPYPFSLENPQGLSYPSKFLPVHVIQHPVTRSVESPSCASGGLVRVEPEKPLLKEGHESLSATPEMKSEKVSEKIGDLKSDFLTLALPEPQLPHATQDLSEAVLKSQGSVDEPNFFSFFPSWDAVDGQATSTVTSCNGEIAEKLDLNLKL